MSISSVTSEQYRHYLDKYVLWLGDAAADKDMPSEVSRVAAHILEEIQYIRPAFDDEWDVPYTVENYIFDSIDEMYVAMDGESAMKDYVREILDYHIKDLCGIMATMAAKGEDICGREFADNLYLAVCNLAHTRILPPEIFARAKELKQHFRRICPALSAGEQLSPVGYNMILKLLMDMVAAMNEYILTNGGKPNE